jgi:hypothetical protein
MRLAFITACMLLVGAYAPRVSLRQQFHQAPAQAQTAPPQRPAQSERDRQRTSQSEFRRANTSVAAESAVARRRAELHQPSGGPESDAQPPQPGNRQLSGAMAVLLALALLNNSDAASPESAQPNAN